MKDVQDYRPLVDFMAEVLGKNTEVVLHDLSNLDHSIIAIANGEISGRHVGDTVTDWTLKLLQQEDNYKVNYISNYAGKVPSERIIASSSYLIRDDDGQLKGMLCVNRDISGAVDSLHYLHRELEPALHLMDSLPAPPPAAGMKVSGSDGPVLPQQVGAPTFENLRGNIEDVIWGMIENRKQEFAVPLPYLKMTDRMALMKRLHQDGMFLLKGSIPILARALDVSEPTIYRYLKSIK